MMRHSVRALVAWSLVGLIGGHQATYLVLYRDPSTILDATGHGWLWVAPILVISGALIAMVMGLLGTGPVQSYRWRFAFLAIIQSATFVTVEVAERAAGGVDPLHLLTDGGLVLTVGVAIQAAIAALLAFASRVVERVAKALHRSGPPTARRRAPRITLPVLADATRSALTGHGPSPRAPPACA